MVPHAIEHALNVLNDLYRYHGVHMMTSSRFFLAHGNQPYRIYWDEVAHQYKLWEGEL